MSELTREETQTEENEELFYEVDDDRKAEDCIRKIKEKQEELERWKEHYKKLFDSIKNTIEHDISILEADLRVYFLTQMEEGNTRKTKTQINYPLPSGKLVLKRQEPTYERDDEVLIDWLEKNAPEFIKTKKEVDWAGLKPTLGVFGENMVTEDAEIVPGIKVEKRDDIFKVEVK